jgi:hypothetical protein
VEVDLDRVRQSYLRNAMQSLPAGSRLGDTDIEFLAAETRTSRTYVQESVDDWYAKRG